MYLFISQMENTKGREGSRAALDPRGPWIRLPGAVPEAGVSGKAGRRAVGSLP